jgi:hypothetical protein
MRLFVLLIKIYCNCGRPNTVRSDYYSSWFQTIVVFVSRVHRLYTDYSTDWMGGEERGEGCHPSDLLCWLTVIWSGAPTDSLGGGPT